MSTELEHNILIWIAEELDNSGSNGIVPVQLLLVRMALVSRCDDERLTQSTVISLNSFDRANLFRTLVHLHKKHYLAFIGQGGATLDDPAVQELYARFNAGEALGQVTLTELGKVEVVRLLRLYADAEGTSENLAETPSVEPDEASEE